MFGFPEGGCATKALQTFAPVLACFIPPALLAGCTQQPKQPSREEMREIWRSPTATTAGVARPSSMTVAQGPAPLVYQVAQTGRLHVTDATTGNELATVFVESGAIVWVDETKGVFANKQKLRPGPLPGGHQYSMSLDMETADSWRAGVEAPKPAPLPATRPAKEPGR